MALSIILYISSILAAIASSCGLVKFVFSEGTYGLTLGLYHLPIVFMMRSSLHGASWAYKYDAVKRVSRRMVICLFICYFMSSLFKNPLLGEAIAFQLQRLSMPLSTESGSAKAVPS